MALLEWQDEYSVNNEEIDQQHKELIALMNSVQEGMKGELLHEAVGSMLDRLIEHTRRHFHSEEELMAEEGFPGINEHRVAHRALTQELVSLRMRHRAGTLALSNEILFILKEWLLGHMKSADSELGVFLANHHATEDR